MLEEEKPDYADKALEIINKYTNPDVREARLKSGLGSAWVGYRQHDVGRGVTGAARSPV